MYVPDEDFDRINRIDRKVFDEAWETVQEHIEYVDALRKKNSLHIITQMADPLEVTDVARKYQLLPRDASHFGIMMNNQNMKSYKYT